MSADLGELGRQADDRKRQRAGAPAPTFRQGVPPSKVGNNLREVTLPPPVKDESPETPTVSRSSEPERARAEEPKPLRPVSGRTEAAPLTRTTIHLTTGEDRFLEEVAIGGRLATPRVDITRSAVARLAIARLAGELAPEEIVALLRDSPPIATTAGGRPRR